MVDRWSRTTRLSAAVAVALVILVSASCLPSEPDGEGGVLPSDTLAPPTTNLVRPTPTPAAAADATTRPIPFKYPTEAIAVPTPGIDQKEAVEMPIPTLPTQGTASFGGMAKVVIALAKADLVQRTGVDAEAITVRSVKVVEWRDSSLGCPRPGMVYAQVLTPGYLVVLETQNRRHRYHTDSGPTVVLCEE